jgi:hypothetical protein
MGRRGDDAPSGGVVVDDLGVAGRGAGGDDRRFDLDEEVVAADLVEHAEPVEVVPDGVPVRFPAVLVGVGEGGGQLLVGGPEEVVGCGAGGERLQGAAVEHGGRQEGGFGVEVVREDARAGGGVVAASVVARLASFCHPAEPVRPWRRGRLLRR